MNKPIFIAAVLFAAAIALGASAQTDSVVVKKAPGSASAMQTIRVTATITAIDPKTRQVKLRGPKDNEVMIEAGPDVKNFGQMKVGDRVNVEYVEAMSLELKKGGGQLVGTTTQISEAGAKSGAMPAGNAGRKVTIVADVTAVDPQKQTITLRGPERTVDLKIPDPEQFKLVAKGDQVEATYSEAVAVKVERVEAGKK